MLLEGIILGLLKMYILETIRQGVAILEERILQDNNQHIIVPHDQAITILLQDTEVVDHQLIITEPIHQDHHLLDLIIVEVLHLQVEVQEVHLQNHLVEVIEDVKN